MTDWLSYRLDDFLLFSARTYYRLFERFNETHPWIHLALFGLGILVVVAALRPSAGSARPVLLALALMHVWSAFAFLQTLYAPINWAITYTWPAFALQAAMLAVVSLRASKVSFAWPRSAPFAAGSALLVIAVLVFPALAPVSGRPLHAAQLFGSAPDPTAVGALGLLLLMRARGRWLLTLVPLAWCAFSGLTLLAMDQPSAWLLLAVMILAPSALLLDSPAATARE